MLRGNLYVYFHKEVRGQLQNIASGCDRDSVLIKATSADACF